MRRQQRFGLSGLNNSFRSPLWFECAALPLSGHNNPDSSIYKWNMGQLTWAIPNIETPNLFYFIFEIFCQFFHAYLKRCTLLDLLFADARVDVKSLHVPWINRSPGSRTAGGQRTADSSQRTADSGLTTGCSKVISVGLLLCLVCVPLELQRVIDSYAIIVVRVPACICDLWVFNI